MSEEPYKPGYHQEIFIPHARTHKELDDYVMKNRESLSKKELDQFAFADALHWRFYYTLLAKVENADAEEIEKCKPGEFCPFETNIIHPKPKEDVPVVQKSESYSWCTII